MAWVGEHVVKPGKMMVPEDFAQTAPVYEPATGIHVARGPEEYSNPHTQAFCDLLQIPNAFHATNEERVRMMQQGPRPDSARPDRRGGYRGGSRAHGQGRGRTQPGSVVRKPAHARHHQVQKFMNRVYVRKENTLGDCAGDVQEWKRIVC
jgi:lariat debranching enzyme